MCWVTFFIYILAWLLVASALLTWTWNKVLRVQTSKVKAIQFKDAVLLLGTIAVLFAPCYAMKMKCAFGKRCHYGMGRSCNDCKECAKGKDCADCKECSHKKDGDMGQMNDKAGEGMGEDCPHHKAGQQK